MCHNTTIDTQLRWFQSRLLHRILPTAKYLSMCNIIQSSQCRFCNSEVETLTHLFWECTTAHIFWRDLLQLIKSKCFNCTNLTFNEKLILFGTAPNIITDNPMDFIILFGKFYLYKCALQEVMPNSECFLKQLKYRKYYEELVSRRNNREEKFQLKWFPYNQIFAFENDS